MSSFKKNSARLSIQKFIDQHPYKVMMYSLTEVSNELFYSEAAIIKALKELGYAGFKDLKKQIYIKEKAENYATKPDDLLLESLIATERLLKDDVMFDVIASKMKNKNIIIQGFGSFRNIAIDYQKMLQLNGFNSFHIEFKEEMNVFDEGSILIVLTSRGSSKLNFDVIERAKRKKIPFWVITNRINELKGVDDRIIPFIHFFKDISKMTDLNIIVRYVLAQLLNALIDMKMEKN